MAKTSALESHQIVLRKYIPEEFVNYTAELILRRTLEFRIVRQRQTKLGDFRC